MKLREIIDRIKGLTGLNQSEIASQIYRIKPSDLSNRISRNSINMGILGEWAGENGVSLDWLLNGYGSPKLNECVNKSGAEYNAVDSAPQADVINLEHAELVKHFTDKKLAREVNENLLEIERLNKAAFKEAAAYIKGIAAGLKSMVAYDRRQGERRISEDPDQTPAQERRNGDRRAASGM